MNNAQMSSDTRNTAEDSEENDQRQITDKNWSWFFVVIFIFWIVAWQYVTEHQTDHDVLSNYFTATNNKPQSTSLAVGKKYILGDSVAAENIPKVVGHGKPNETNPRDETDTKDKTESIIYQWIYLVIDVFTCNPSRLVEHGEKFMFVLVIGVFIQGSLIYFLLSLISMSNNKMFYKQPSIFGATFLFVALLEHFSASSSIAFSLLPVHKRLAYWTVPETAFLIFCLSKMMSKRKSTEKNRLLPLPFYVYTIAVGIPMLVILELLIASTVSISHNLGWNSVPFCMIAGGSCYIGLTIYYFGLMVISCAMRVSSDGPQSLWKDPFRAMLIAARYHFGTACYHATLILPRLRAFNIMNESIFKALEESSAEEVARSGQRFRFTKGKIHSHSITLTAVYGTDYSDSLRRLLRFWSNDAFSKEYIYYYGLFYENSFMFIMGANSLMIIFFWYLGLNDPNFSMAAWVMYIKIMVMYYLALQCFKATSDAIVYSIYRKIGGPSDTIPTEKLCINFVRVPNTKSYEVRVKLA